MKKWLCILMLMFSFTLTSHAQQQYQTYKASSYAIASINKYNGKYTWSDWYQCSVKIVFNLSKDVITIYSNEQQTYFIVETEGTYTDNSGGKQISFKVIDQDRDRGHVRLRIERNGNSQLYVDFADIAWVYNVTRTS